MSAQPVSPSVVLDTSRPFTTQEAYAAGLTSAQLASTAYARVFHSVYVASSTTRTLLLRVHAAQRIAPPSAMASHHTAALIWGGSVPRQSEIHLSMPKRVNCQVVGIRPHRYAFPATPVLYRGIRLTTPERTMCDLAQRLDLVELVTLGDRLVRRGATTPARLTDAADEWSGPFAPRLRRAAALVREGVDSPPESRLRVLMVLAGLPEPAVNHIIRDPETGEWMRRFELAYPELMLAIEYHGRWHMESEEVWSADIERREELGRRTWRVVEVIAKTLDEDPIRILRRIDAARVDRGAAPTRRLAEGWRAYFPGSDRRHLR